MNDMKKLILGLSALCMMTVTSCKEDATTKIKSENVTEAADRDAVNVDFPVLALPLPANSPFHFANEFGIV